MSFVAGDADRVPAESLHSGHDADVGFLSFENRSLFDVKLERGRERSWCCRSVARPTEPVEFACDAEAIVVDQVKC